MAGAFGVQNGDQTNVRQYHGHLTMYVVVACIVAAMGGLIFGYDIGISGRSDFHGAVVKLESHDQASDFALLEEADMALRRQTAGLMKWQSVADFI